MTGKISRFLVVAGVVLGLAPAVAYAQGTTISGQVTGTGGAPVVGASVSIPTLRVGGFTDETGRYSFTVPESATGTTVTLIARRLGFAPSSAQVTLSAAPVTQNFSLSPAATELQGVVVTALGLTREKSQLGTAQQQLSNTELNQTRAQNVVQQIQGKVSGVQITGAGTQGGTTNIVIRGQNSMTGSNQPLFIVDGVAVSNASRGGNLIADYDFGSAISDLNSDDIATFSVLKGPNAAAIYGSRAANGVIVITTKKGQTSGGRIQTEISSNITFERPSILPDWQNSYGQGTGGRFRFVNGAGGGLFDGSDQSFGPKLDGRTHGCTFLPGTTTYDTSAPCLQFNSPTAASPWMAHPDNVERFFETGRTLSTTLSMSGGTERANARVSIGADNVNGIFPNNVFQRRTAMLSGTLRATDRLSADATLQYIRNTGRNRPGTGYLNSTLEQFFWFGRQVDTRDLENYAQGAVVNSSAAFASREYNWNYNFHNNPYWTAYENPIFDSRDRVIGSISANYKLLDWLNLTARSGSDIYRLNIDQQWAAGNITNADQAFAGAFEYVNDYRNDNTSDLLLAADRQIGSRIRFNGLMGGGRRFEHFASNSQATAGISVPGIYNVSNAAIAPTLGQNLTRRQVNSVYGSAAFTLNNWWTVEGTARNDWSSTLPLGANSYFYPSVNTSIVVTDAVPALQGRIVSYLKVRGSVAQVGNDAPPYSLATTYIGNSDKFFGLPQFSLSNTLANAELKPEITRSDEGGVELGLFNGRVTLDASLYNKTTRNQIFNVTVSPTSGFTSKSINAGRINNRGFEALLTVSPIQMDNGFNWTTTFNYTQNKSKVAELAPGIATIVLGRGIFGEVNVEARAGLPYGTIFGSYFERDAEGRLLLDRGRPYGAAGFKVLGNIQPQWIGGIGNQFSFGGLSLNVLFDIRQGGKIVSQTNEVGEVSGVLASTLRGREVDWNDPGIIADGIDVNTGQPNTIRVTAEQYFQSFFPLIEPYIYDGSYVKLRELRLGFDVPARFASRFGMQSLGIALTGRNLKTWTDVPNIDPEFAYNSTNFQGIEYAIPSNPRSIGLSFRLTP